MPHPGQMLGDRYRLDDRIAAGGMGEVWQATDTVLGRDVAVKTLQAGRAGDAGFQTRFRHEARAMAVLHHPGIADVYDYGQTTDGSESYIVMAYVKGQALNDLIAERGRLSPAETMSIVAQAGRALEAAHEAGIVHRDVKPGNLIIEPDGKVVLVDFGVARSAESPDLTGAKEVVGTALYIAPEQISKQQTGPPADIYALGAVAFHCLTGHPPFEGKNPIAVAMQHLREDPPPLPEDVPFPVRRLVATALAKDPADRYPSAAVMAAAADAAMSATPGQETTILAAPALGAAAAAAAAARATGSGGFAPGKASVSGPVRPAPSSGTAVMPAIDEPYGSEPVRPGPPGPSEPAHPGGSGGRRNRTMLLVLAAILLLAGIAVAAAYGFSGKTNDPGPVKPSATPGQSAPAASATTKKSSHSGSSTQGGNGGQSSAAASGAPNPGGTHQTGGAPATTVPAPTTKPANPTTEPTTAAPTTAAPTSAAAANPTGTGANNPAAATTTP